MSGIIRFDKDSSKGWLRAGWAFRQILEDTLAQCPGDAEMAAEFEIAKTIGGLNVSDLNPELALRVSHTMKTVIAGILSGNIQSGLHGKLYGDPPTISQYHESLKELLSEFPPESTDSQI